MSRRTRPPVEEKIIAYYVSGHGFGHARRTAEILRSLTHDYPHVSVIVRTTAPAGIFANIPNVSVEVPTEHFDPGVVEDTPLAISPARSMAGLAGAVVASAGRVNDEAAWLRAKNVSLVVTDVAFLAGDAAEAAGIPCVALGNFTWDWIHELYADGRTAAVIDRVRASYGKMRAVFRLPFSHEMPFFPKVIPVPLVAVPARHERNATLRRLGLRPSRRYILVAMRGGIDAGTLRRAAEQFKQVKDMIFLAPDLPANHARANLRPFTLEQSHRDPLDFSDVLAACDAVVSKLGYGIVSDCIASGVPLLYPPRVGFREDGIMVREAPKYLRMREIGPRDFHAGNWRNELTALLEQPAPAQRLSHKGAAALAKKLATLL